MKRLALPALALLAACAAADGVRPDVAQDLAPTGRLDLARELGRRLGVPVELIAYDAAGKVTDAVKTGAWDIAFVAIDPARAMEIAFTPPYVVIEGTYLVAADSPLRTIADVDREGVRIAVSNKSAYDLYLTRTLKRCALPSRVHRGDEGLGVRRARAGEKRPARRRCRATCAGAVN